MIHQHDISQEEFEQIERYLNNEMGAEEAAVFVAQMITDEKLQQKVEEVKLLLLGLKEAVLEEKLNTFHSNIKSNDQPLSKTVPMFPRYKKWLIAASVISIAFLSVWWLVNADNENEKLYAAYYSPDPGLITAMGNSEDYSFEKAMVDYKEGNYKKAIDAWSKLKVEAPQSDTLNYFLGVAQLANKNSDKAKELLGTITANVNKPFYKEACWYLGLILLKEGEKDKALELIKRSGNTDADKLINEVTKK